MPLRSQGHCGLEGPLGTPKFNFGEEEFKFPPKDGFVALSKAPESFVVKSQHAGRYCTQWGKGFKKRVW